MNIWTAHWWWRVRLSHHWYSYWLRNHLIMYITLNDWSQAFRGTRLTRLRAEFSMNKFVILMQFLLKRKILLSISMSWRDLNFILCCLFHFPSASDWSPSLCFSYGTWRKISFDEWTHQNQSGRYTNLFHRSEILKSLKWIWLSHAAMKPVPRFH